MKKENFICPCCGLPNHLEFKSKDDYDSYLEGQHSSDKFETNPNNYQFNRYILEENEEESDGRKKEIEDRFNLIKDYWNKYQNFEEWFGKEVIGFIPDEEIEPEDYIAHYLAQSNFENKNNSLVQNFTVDYIENYMHGIMDALEPQSTGCPTNIDIMLNDVITEYLQIGETIYDIIIRKEVI